MLAFAEHVVVAKNMLTEAWSPERLKKFFGDMPVSEWFNRTAPMVRDGVIDPDSIDREIALTKMIAEPLLIRRPLMIIDGTAVVGFDAQQLNADFSLGLETGDGDLESCPRDPQHEKGCEVKA